MATRTISGTIYHADSTPWVGATVRFAMETGTFTLSPDVTYLHDLVTAVTTASGTFSATLTSGLSVYWICTLPDGESFIFALPDGSPVTLETLRAFSEGLPVPVPGVFSDADYVVTSPVIGDMLAYDGATFINRPNEVYNAQDYGATGDGVTDDTAACQMAIDACLSAGGGVVYLPTGRYAISAALRITGAMTLQGAGRRLSTILLNSTTLNAIVVDIAVAALSDYDTTHFSNFGIIGDDTAPTAGDLITIQTSTSIPVEGPVFRDLWFQDGWNGLHIESGATYTIDNCHFYRQFNHGIFLEDTVNHDHGDGVITNNFFLGRNVTANAAAVHLASGGGLRFTDNIAAVYDYGIRVVLASGAATSEFFITNNRINLVDVAAITFEKGGGTEVNTVAITGNKLMSKGRAIDLSDANVGWLYGVAITGNVLWGYTGGTPTVVDIATATDFVISGNTFIPDGLSPTAINIGADASGVIIGNNIGFGFTTRIANASPNVTVIQHDFSVMTVKTLIDEQVLTSGGTAQSITRAGADELGAFFTMQKTRNANPTLHTIIQNGDEIGYLSWQGSNGTAYREAARITAHIDGTPGSGNDMPGAITFWTTPDGSATIAAQARVHNDGGMALKDGITAPATHAGWATLYVDTADGDLKVKFGDGTVKTIVVDT